MPRPSAFEETPTPSEKRSTALGAARFVIDAALVLVSLATAALPFVEKLYFTVLPVTARIRGSLMPVAILASVVAVFAGVATARQTGEGLTIGWVSLVLFLATTIALYSALDVAPRAASGLYIVFFASFSLAVTSFLSSHGSSSR